jgi:hypothetical protein
MAAFSANPAFQCNLTGWPAAPKPLAPKFRYDAFDHCSGKDNGQGSKAVNDHVSNFHHM